MRRIVIVGAGLAGGSAATALRKEGFDGEITLVGAEPHPPYERPPLSKSYLRGETPFEEAFLRPVAFYSKIGIDLRLGTPATAFDPHRRTVAVGADEIPYDRLLVATGSRNRRTRIPGIELEGVYSLRTVEECDRLRDAIGPGLRAVVGGMSFLGSEVAASLVTVGVDVTAILSSRYPLEATFGELVGRALASIHLERGVRLVTDDRVAAIEGNGRVQVVVTSKGLRIPCDLAFLAFGVEPVLDLVLNTPVELDNGIVTDELCRTSLEDVYACGDVTNHFLPLLQRRVRIEHWHNALRQGRAAARSMLGKGGPYDEVPWFWSDQYEHELQYAGFHEGWDDVSVQGDPGEGSFSAYYFTKGALQAAVAIDRAADIRHAIQSISAGRS